MTDNLPKQFNIIFFLFLCFLIKSIKSSCELPEVLLEDTLLCVERNKYPNYYVDIDNVLKKCKYPCYECSKDEDDDNQNCLSCERGYEFDSSTNSCIKCPKDKYKYIYSSYNTCINSNEDYCKKEVTKCTLLTDEIFKGCPKELPILIESKKICVSKNKCNSTDFLNGVCKISNIEYIESRKINQVNILNKEELKNKYNTGMYLDKYGNLLFEACGDFDEYRYYYGIKKNGKENFTDIYNNPTYFYISVGSTQYIKGDSFILLYFNPILEGNTFISFFPENFTFELENVTLGNMDNKRFYKNNLNAINKNKEKVENHTITSIINSFIKYNNSEYDFFNIFFLSYVAVDNSNEYSLFIWSLSILTIQLEIYSYSLIEIKPVDNYMRITLCQTEIYILISLYLHNQELKVILINSKTFIINKITKSEITIANNINNNDYFSCLSLFDETFLFIYFKEKNLILSINNINLTDYSIIDYNSEINNVIINNDKKYPISSLYSDNEAIKINYKKFVIISKYENNETLLIILCELYNKIENIYKSLNVRYYELSLVENNIEIYKNYHIFLFNGLFGIYYYNKKTSYPSYIIFGYISSEDPETIDNLFDTKNNYTIKFSDYFSINNNILGYEAKIKIITLPNSETSGIYLYSSNYQQVYENTILDITDSITFAYISESLISGTYNLSFIPVSRESSLFSFYNYYSDKIETFGEEINQQNDYLNDIEEFEGEEAQFSFSIIEDKSNFCDSSCKICNINQCFSCIKPSEFPAELKTKCFPLSSPPGNEYYFNNTINVYILCHENCDTCNGTYDESTNNHNCINCKNGYIKMKGTNNCYPENENIYSYIKNEENSFIRCDRHCETCSAPPTEDGYYNCNSCDPEQNYILFNKSYNCLNCFSRNKIADFEQKKCIFESEIPDGYYLNENKIVEKCYKNCKTCSNGEIYQNKNNIDILNMNCDSCDTDNNYYFIETEINNCYLENDIPKNYYKKYDLEKNESKYYECYQLCGSCDDGGTENNMKCISCINNNDYELIYGNCFNIKECLYFYIRNISNYYNKECLNENEICIEDYPFLFQNECKINCTYEELINKKCIPTNKPNAHQKVHNIIFDKLKNEEITLDNKNNFEDIIIDGIDSYYHLTTDINQNDIEYNKKLYNYSHIEFGECEEILKKKNNLDMDAALFVFIVEIIRNDTPTREVEYEVFNPDNLDINLDLSVCEDIPITITSPISLDENQFNIYKNAKNQGYDIYKSDDKFYNDVCTPYNNENDTDVVINDRKNDYYQNISLCENNCVYKGIDIETRRVNCFCKVKTEMYLIDYLIKIKFEPNNIIANFYKVYDNSNIKVLQCYKLVFNIDNFKINIGSYLILFLSSLFMVSTIISIFQFKKNIINIINNILDKMYFLFEKQSSTVKKKYSTKIKTNKSNNNICVISSNPPKSKKRKNEKNNTKIIYNNNNNNIIINNIINKEHEKNENNKFKVPFKRGNKIQSKTIKINQNSDSTLKDASNNKFFNPKDLNINSKLLLNNKEYKKKNKSSNRLGESASRNKEFQKTKKPKKTKKLNEKIDKNKKEIYLSFDYMIKKLKPTDRYNYLIEEEINNLDYFDAIEIDFRTFGQYYWSLLKSKQLILFTFINYKDYNIIIAKFSLFILSFTVYFTINTFFFTDESIHNIYENNSYNILSQIIQIVISTVISVVINFLRYLLNLFYI